ncbi:MAG: hypothetical protein KBS86_02985 [Proteobacteria bacterium]|nr:hypothetical protein [Candidatus Enterousia scatequi]
MITDDINFDNNVPDGVWIGAESDPLLLASGVEFAVAQELKFVSVMPGAVDVIWPWLENRNIDIYSRFYIENMDGGFSKFVVAATHAFKHGANGALVFMRPSDVVGFAGGVLPVREDLFFYRKLFIGLDICAVDACDWDGVFSALVSVRADGLFLVYTHENGDKSDFVGRIMNMIDAWHDDYVGELYISFGANFMRIEQVCRLMQYEKPNIKIHIVGMAK